MKLIKKIDPNEDYDNTTVKNTMFSGVVFGQGNSLCGRAPLLFGSIHGLYRKPSLGQHWRSRGLEDSFLHGQVQADAGMV